MKRLLLVVIGFLALTPFSHLAAAEIRPIRSDSGGIYYYSERLNAAFDHTGKMLPCSGDRKPPSCVANIIDPSFALSDETDRFYKKCFRESADDLYRDYRSTDGLRNGAKSFNHCRRIEAIMNSGFSDEKLDEYYAIYRTGTLRLQRWARDNDQKLYYKLMERGNRGLKIRPLGTLGFGQ